MADRLVEMRNDSESQSTGDHPNYKKQNQACSQLSAVHRIRSFMEITAYATGISAVIVFGIASLLGILHLRDPAIWTTWLACVLALTGGFCWLQDRMWKKDAAENPILSRIKEIDNLREGGRKLQRIFGAPNGNLPDGEPDRWLEKVRLSLQSISRSYAQCFDEILKDPRRHTGVGMTPEFTLEEMKLWQSDPRRQQEWPRITAVLHYLDQIRDKLYKKLR